MFGKKLAFNGIKHRVVRNVNGYYKLSPLPTAGELDDFYKKNYYELIKKGGRAPELMRQMKRGKESLRERKWLQSTLYQDIISVIRESFNGSRVRLLDIGCGSGEMIRYMSRNGFEAFGIEPYEKKKDFRSTRGIEIFTGTLAEAVMGRKAWKRSFDVVTLMSVLEHVPNPDEVISQAAGFLKPGRGLICIRVPNDFNPLQFFAHKALKKRPWWVAVPDHLNYFSVDALSRYLSKLGFDPVYVTTDFPMELFLLLGDDYVGRPDIGKECHRKRIMFESALDPEFRRKLYRTFAELGIGRDVMIFAKLRKPR